jgi:MFS family permease
MCNPFLPCCSVTNGLLCGQCADKFSWFSPLLLLLGELWIWMGAGILLTQADNIRDAHNESYVNMCTIFAVYWASTMISRPFAETICRFIGPRFAYLCGIVCHCVGYASVPWSETFSAVCGAACVFAGVGASLMAVGHRCAIPDQEPTIRASYECMANIFRATGAFVSGPISFHLSEVISWQGAFYLYAGVSTGILLFVVFFMRRRVFIPTPDAYACAKAPYERTIIALVAAEIFTGGVRWGVPTFITVHFIVSSDFSPKDVMYVTSSYIGSSMCAQAAREIVRKTSMRADVYSYIVSACMAALAAMMIAYTDNHYMSWTIAIFAGITGFFVGGAEGIVHDSILAAYTLQTTSLTCTTGGLSALVWILTLATQIDSEGAHVPLTALSAICIPPLLCAVYIMMKPSNPKAIDVASV